MLAARCQDADYRWVRFPLPACLGKINELDGKIATRTQRNKNPQCTIQTNHSTSTTIILGCFFRLDPHLGVWHNLFHTYEIWLSVKDAFGGTLLWLGVSTRKLKSRGVLEWLVCTRCGHQENLIWSYHNG
jgi:hypothetical protein